jgi:hypothetical protein
MTKREKIIRTLMDYPNLSPWQVSKRVGCHVSYVHKVESDWLKDEAKPAATEVKDDRQTEMFTVVEHVSESSSGTIDAVLNERGSRYGKFTDHASVTQAYKTLMFCQLEERDKRLAADQQEALDMIFHKIGRIINGDPDYADSWVDIAGYAKLVADRLEGKVR